MAALKNMLMYAVKIEHFPGLKGVDLSENIAATWNFRILFCSGKQGDFNKLLIKKWITRVVCNTKLCNCCYSHHQQFERSGVQGCGKKELCGFWFHLCLWITLQSWASGLTSLGLYLFSCAVKWAMFHGPRSKGLKIPWELRTPWRSISHRYNTYFKNIVDL